MIKIDSTPKSARSLANMIAGQVKDTQPQPLKYGWSIARQVWADDATAEELETAIAKIISEEAPNPSSSLDDITGQEQLSKNERIRQALAAGFTISTIAKAMGLTYQRVKNVELRQKAK